MYTIPGWLGTNVFCIILLMYIGLEERKAYLHAFPEIKAFRTLIWFSILAFIADSLSRLYQYPAFNFMYPLIVIGTYAKYIMVPLIVPFYYKYYLIQVNGEKNIRSGSYYFVWFLQTIVTIMVITSYYTHWALYFDKDRIYHRGILYALPMGIMIFMAIYVEAVIIIKRRKIYKKNYNLLVMFLIPPLIGAILQSLLYGLALCQMGFSLSTVIVYINTVSRDVNRDYLTGLANRKTFSQYLENMINDETYQPFSVLMMDLDDFKDINDTLGHIVGDDALESFATILLNCVRKNDLVCRYGGDEFFVLLNRSDERVLKVVKSRIKHSVEEFNKRANKPYELHFSVGGSVYRQGYHVSAKDFIDLIDNDMYKDKKERKARKNKEIQSTEEKEI